MLGKTHLIFAILILSFIFTFSFENILFLGVILFSVLIPDLDNSSIGIFIKHRGIMHSLLFPFIIGILLIPFITLTFVKAFWIGYSLHLLGDILTIAGVPLLWPSKKKASLKIFKVGGTFEKVLFYVLFAILAVRVFLIIS